MENEKIQKNNNEQVKIRLTAEDIQVIWIFVVKLIFTLKG